MSYDLDNCEVCHKPVDEETRARAHRDVAPPICSTECRQKKIKQVYACCEKAEFSNCVCMYSFTCPDHGNTHIGTHD